MSLRPLRPPLQDQRRSPSSRRIPRICRRIAVFHCLPGAVRRLSAEPLPLTWDKRTAWTGEARTFYRKLKTDASLLDAIAPYPIDVDKGIDALDVLEDEVEQRRVETGEAEAATMSRNAAFDDLSGYMSAFLTVAEMALKDVDPQQAEKLNLTAPSTR